MIVDIGQEKSRQLSVHVLGHILIARGAGMEQKQMQKIVVFVDREEGEGFAEAKTFPTLLSSTGDNLASVHRGW